MSDDSSSPGFLRGDSLEGRIGKPRAEWQVNDVVDIAIDTGVRIVSLMHVGGDGWLKTLDFVPRSIEHLRDILEGGERADGSSLFRGMGIRTDASDVVLRPRPETGFLDPFTERPTLAILCSHLGRDGKPLPQSPDTILRAACARLEAELGIELTALGEVEYFLGKPYDATDIYGSFDRGYHAVAPFVFGQRHRRKAMDVLSEIGLPVKYGHSEVGYIEAGEADGTLWEQHEIELALQPLPNAADSVLLTQWVLRLLARREGLRCNTDPMMLTGHAGNGLHVHLSARQDGSHLPVGNGREGLAEHAGLLVGGLVSAGAALMAFGNCDRRSFERLVQGKEAPGTIRWGSYDRSAMVRIPVVPQTADGRPAAEPTVEFRLPDGSAMVHLLLAGIAQSMLAARQRDDLAELLASTSTADGADDGSAEAIPRHPEEVARAVERQRALLEAGGVFPAQLLDQWIERLRSRPAPEGL